MAANGFLGRLAGMVGVLLATQSSAIFANDGCACPGVPSCALPGWCAPGCAAPGYGCPTGTCQNSGYTGGASCDDGCCPNCRSKSKWSNREKGPFIQIICSKYKMPAFGAYHAPYAVVTQSMPAVLTNQSAVMPIMLAGVQTQSAPFRQSAPEEQSTKNDSACCNDLERKVDRLRADVDELADSTRRLTLVLDKIDQKLTTLEEKVDKKADKNP